MTIHRDFDIMKIDEALTFPVSMEARVILIVQKLALNGYGVGYGVPK